ncbi:MAG: hypothetical protein JWM41_1473 [Gemmatimonadetes bacterium]|nr:hypothetical protein [Gemmatimonadota bacterium]
MKFIITAALAIVMAACGSQDATSPTASVSGDYALRMVNGTSLPYTFSDGSTLTSDVLTLRSDGTFSESAQFRDGTVLVLQGFYAANNGAITFTDQDTGTAFSGSVSGDVLTEIFANGLTEVFQRI